MEVCREIFVFIQQKLAKKTYPAKIPLLRVNIGTYIRPPWEKRIFSLDVVWNTHFCTLSTIGEAYM